MTDQWMTTSTECWFSVNADFPCIILTIETPTRFVDQWCLIRSVTGRDLWLVEELAQQMTLGALSITNYQFPKLPKDSIKNPYKTDKWSVAGREFWLVEDLAQQILNIHRQNFQKIPSTRLYQWLISGWQRMLMRLDGVAHLHNSSILRNQHQNKNPDESEQWASMKRLVNYPTPFSVTIKVL